MKTTIVGMLALACLMIAAGNAQADDRDYRKQGYRDGDGWRLGERIRGGFAIYRRSGRGWHRVPGAAIAVADGWVLGAGRESGGYAIYRWNGHGWDQAPGGAVRIGGSYRRPWVVNNRGQRFVWNGYDWRRDQVFRGSRQPRHERSFGDDRRFDDRDRDRRRFEGRNRSGKRHDSWQRQQDHSRGRRRGNW